MDGTLVDNIPYHLQAWQVVLERVGRPLSAERIKSQNHGSLEEVVRAFLGQDTPADEVLRVGQLKETTYRELYRPHLSEVRGLSALLDALRRSGLKLGLATMGDQTNIDYTLGGLGLATAFDAVTGGHQVSRGKPDPEVFLATLAKLGVAPLHAVVVEDTLGGVQGARAAGAAVVGLTTSYTAAELLAAGCVHAVDDFEQLALWWGL